MSTDHLDRNDPRDILENAMNDEQWETVVVVGLAKDGFVRSAWNTSSPLTRMGILQCAINDCLQQMEEEGEKSNPLH